MTGTRISGVKKRNGETVEFAMEKIKKAIEKAFLATETVYTEDILELLSLRAVSKTIQLTSGNILNIEDIQDSVEKVLEESGFTEVAKAYILYRKQHEKIREIDKNMLDFAETVN
ncbi:MAG TPA: ATP cone domain-containing protein, partial [Tepiditoga sp.]|nr:ATP cone domain-containing protein [Tepiditoga sp.]